ncbi:MAG: hypothetical protein LBL65_05455 [Campylobacteraceae bacterium]|jgi:hypothetical protein|nr:hypothetical protein [Campylobacteraceae bacterium]
MQKVIIPLSKSKMILLFTVSVLFITIGYWVFGLDTAYIESNRRFNNPFLVHGIGLMSAILGVFCVIAIVRRLADPAAGLIMDEFGITDNSAAFSLGLIPWSDISGFEICQVQWQRFLCILLKDPDAYISKLGIVKQALLKANRRIVTSPVAINSNSLSISFDELVTLIEQYFAAYNNSSKPTQLSNTTQSKD